MNASLSARISAGRCWRTWPWTCMRASSSVRPEDASASKLAADLGGAKKERKLVQSDKPMNVAMKLYLGKKNVYQ